MIMYYIRSIPQHELAWMFETVQWLHWKKGEEPHYHSWYEKIFNEHTCQKYQVTTHNTHIHTHERNIHTRRHQSHHTQSQRETDTCTERQLIKPHERLHKTGLLLQSYFSFDFWFVGAWSSTQGNQNHQHYQANYSCSHSQHSWGSVLIGWTIMWPITPPCVISTSSK